MRFSTLLTGTVALVILTGAAVPVAFAGPPTSPLAVEGGGLGIRLLDAPVSRRDDPRAVASIVDHLLPGTTITRNLEVINDADRALAVRVYVGSATVSSGDFIGDPGAGSGDLPTWAQVSTPSVQVPAAGRSKLSVQIAIPPNASAGERYGVIWAEPPPSTSGGVSQVNRVGVRVYLSVGPGGEPPSDFTIDTLTAGRSKDGRPQVLAKVHNTGGRALDMRGDLKLSDGPGGLSAGPFDAKLGTTLGLGQTEPVTIVLDKALPAGPWLARIALRSGRLSRSATATITFPDAAGAQALPVQADAVPFAKDHKILLPIAGGLIGLLVLLLLAVGLTSSRRKARGRVRAQ